MVESSDKMQSTGEGNGKLHQYTCLQNPMNPMGRGKKKKSLVLPNTNCVFQDPVSKNDSKQRFSVNVHFGGENIQPCAEGRHNSPLLKWDCERGNRQKRLHLENRTPSWARLWTLSYMPSIYGKDIPTGKPDPQMEEPQGSYLDSLSPKRIP